ncbi:filamentous hemagglutinin N-terminal domain-containing protein [Bordetella avium]|uniref:two-partner secretion domain-containing protein n=1 Tax=Bordetella avium TaxID=521 RepID=UPI0019D44F5A|nr:filamentous hemagglutinin N-terminal domain-containing protein [Bordetella avium]
MRKYSKSLANTILASLIGAQSFLAAAAPSGGVVVSGGITIGSMNNSEMVIVQALKKGIINWTDFSINSGELIRFVQSAGNDSITLNRVLGSQVSNIQGALQANGNIFLINPNGIVFGANASVDVAGLLATTFDVSDASFLGGGRLDFTQVVGKDLAGIVNQGFITAGNGGFIYLVAPKVNNSGALTANVGSITLATGDRFSVNLQGSNLINFSVSANTLAAAMGEDLNGVRNSGVIAGQTVLLEGNSASGLMSSVVNNSGILEATDLTIRGADIVQAGTIKGMGTAAATTVTLSASQSILTPALGSARANTLNLAVRDPGASLGTADQALQFDADVLNATSLGGSAWLTDVNGGVALGAVSADTASGSVVITAKNGSITSADSTKTNVAGYSAKFLADGSVGTDSVAVNTKVSLLTASTQNGGINVSNTGALTLGDVIAREQIMVNGQPTSSEAVDMQGSIVLSDGSVGSKRVKIQASQDITVNGTLSAGGALSVGSAEGSIRTTQTTSQLVGRVIDLSAGQGVGDAVQSLNTRSNLVNAAAGNGGVYLMESNGLTIGDIHAAGNASRVELGASQGDIVVGSITAAGGSVSLSANNGGIVAQGATTNVTAEGLTVNSQSGIGSSSQALTSNVSEIAASTTAPLAAISISNIKALNKLSLSTANGNVHVAFAGGVLAYDPILTTLMLSRTQALDLAFSNTTAGMKLNGINAGSSQTVSLSAAGDITQGSGSVLAQNLLIDTTGNIGSTASALQTQARNLDLTSANGLIHVANTSSNAIINASALNDSVNIRQSGNLELSSISARSHVSAVSNGDLSVSGDISSVSGNINLSGAAVYQNAAINTGENGNIDVKSNGPIVMAASSQTVADKGKIRYESGSAISVARLQAATGIGGGAVTLVAPRLIDALPGQVNVFANEISLSANNLTSALIQDLTGQVIATNPVIPAVPTNSDPTGLIVANRRYMAPLLFPLPMQQHSPAGLLASEMFHGSPGQPLLKLENAGGNEFFGSK